MSEAIYTADGAGFVPTGHARGPWDGDSQHGGPPAALLARAIECLDAPGPMLVARLTVEFLRPVPLVPLEVRAEIVRPGRRLQLAEAHVLADGQEVLRARAVRLRRAPVAVPDAARPGPRLAGPEAIEPARIPLPPHGHDEGFARTGMELRFVEGRFTEPGPATAWFRLRVPLIEGEETTPMERTMVAADFGNGISAALAFERHLFVNTDLTVHLLRQPVGEWIGVEAVTEHGPEGTALAASVLHDADGPVGRAQQSLFVDAR